MLLNFINSLHGQVTTRPPGLRVVVIKLIARKKGLTPVNGQQNYAIFSIFTVPGKFKKPFTLKKFCFLHADYQLFETLNLLTFQRICQFHNNH